MKNVTEEFDFTGLTAYSGYFRDTQKLLQSVSGGAATALSEAIINEGGTVFGACYSSDFKSAEFACIEDKKDLDKIKGSKYFPTRKRIFQNGEYKLLWDVVAEKLETGKKVLFTGLGCDVGALKFFLNNNGVDDSNLYTVDLICHGIGSQKVHVNYLETLEKKYNSKIIGFNTRVKKCGWGPQYMTAEFENGKNFSTPFRGSDYHMTFVTFNIFARKACYSCKFKGKNHQADITVGDYWGLKKDMSGYNHNGVSIFIVRTEKGEELINKIGKNEFMLQPADISFALSHNRLYFKCPAISKDYEKFFDDLKTVGLHKAVMNHYGRIKYLLRPVKNFLKKFRRFF